MWAEKGDDDMDERRELKPGTILLFPGIRLTIERSVGRGSNALVYEGSYPDASSPGRRHRVLVKELFPYDPRGRVYRDEKLRVCVGEGGEELYRLHRLSFERGVEIHLQLLEQRPGEIGGNLNTCALNQTLYTLLDFSGGRSLEAELHGGAATDLSTAIARTRKLLFALRVFHEKELYHLDVSPDNVLLIGEGERERVLLIDFNSVHSREELLEGRGLYFSAKEGFTAPEIQTGMPGAAGAHTDLFAATCVFYAMLTGSPPELAQLVRKNPPDAGNSPLLFAAPATARTQARKILRRGLCALPEKRYASCDEMLRDLDELKNRLDGVGVTHAALWEAGRGSMERLARQNPSLAYLRREEELYPLRVAPEDGISLPADEFLAAVAEGKRPSSLLLGEGGAGKSTALLRVALRGAERYSPLKPAVVYLPLYGWKRGEGRCLLDRILAELLFDPRTRTLEDARHALQTLLKTPLGGGEYGPPTLLLLLDGLNEVRGDVTELTREIESLSALPGLRIVVSSRTEAEGLRLKRTTMSRLEEADVESALGRRGLLTPQSGEMRLLLRNPMMLSLYIQTAQSDGGQTFCATEKELLDGYFDALCEKAAREAGRDADYLTEAAVRLALPAIARETQKRGATLDEPALYKVVKRCYSALKGKTLSRVFPQWLGHGREALGVAENDSELWYSVVVWDTLWRRLGLLIREEDGRYRVRHQILQDELARRGNENARRLRRYKAGRVLKRALCVAVALLLCLLIGGVWSKPRPHDETASAVVLDACAMQYINCGLQYEAMTELLAGEISPETCAQRVAAAGAPASRSALSALDALTAGNGEVVPWSGKALAQGEAAALLALPEERAALYARCIRAFRAIETGEAATPREAFFQTLKELLEADADEAWLLERAACRPHLEGMSSLRRQSYETAILSLPDSQDDRSPDVSRGMGTALEKARERGRIARNELNGTAAMHAPEERTE